MDAEQIHSRFADGCADLLMQIDYAPALQLILDALLEIDVSLQHLIAALCDDLGYEKD